MNNPEQLRGFLKFDQIAKATKLAAQRESEQAFHAEEVVGNPLAQLEISERELTPQEQTILWANQVLEKHNSLAKGNRAEKTRARNLATQTAGRLLENPQDIDIAGSVWKSREGYFYDLVKQEVLRDIRKQRRTTTPEQFGQLLRVRADSVLMQDVFYDLLARDIKGPQQGYQLLTIQEASDLLRVHTNTLRRWDAKGTLKAAARLGNRGDRRFRLEDVMKLINKN